MSNGAFGILFGWIYVRSGRNLWITIIGHDLLNPLGFWLLYSGNVGKGFKSEELQEIGR